MTTGFVANVVVSGALVPHTHLTHVCPVHFLEINKMQYIKMKSCEKALLHKIIYSTF